MRKHPPAGQGPSAPASTRARGRHDQLAEAKLAGSDLTMADAKALGIDVLSPEATEALGQPALPALRFNYYAPTGEPMRDWPGADRAPFYRLRFLEVKKDFNAVNPDARPLRYVQPVGTACCAYFPRTTDWAAALAPLEPIIITEGELKAACACKHGLPTIGLGGVHSWRAVKQGVEFLPELESIPWQGRQVYVAFDSDYKGNQAVCAALRELAEALQERGAYVHVVSLPSDTDGPKTGLDDYLLANGADGLRGLLKTAQPLGLTRVLFQLNERYCYVQSPGLVVRLPAFDKIPPDAFRSHVEATKSYLENVLRADGGVSSKRVAAGASWLTWPIRRQAERMTFQPGAPMESDAGLNSWPGWGVEPVKGDVSPFLQLVGHLFKGAEPEALEWFLDWLAYPLQYPGAKLFSSACFHGTRHGTGKSLVGYTMGRIYGRNFQEITQADLHGGFNDWAQGAQFVLGDDVTGSNKRADSDMLKKLITQREMRVNIKFIPSYTIPDCVNYFFTSNQPDAFFLEDDDRRYFIHEVLEGPMEFEFYRSYCGTPASPGWLGQGGASALFYWLLKRDLSRFHPAAAAMRTAARSRMIADIQSDLGGWVRAMLESPNSVLRVGNVQAPRDLWTSRELLALYDPTGKTGTTANGLGRELRRAGVHPVCGGTPVKTQDGLQGRYYPVRNRAQWVHATMGACALHIDAKDPKSPRKPKY